MKYSIVYKVLTRTICAEFYRLNAGFFFVTIAFAFGLLRPIEHIALATYFVHSYFLLAMLFVVWILYTLKAVQFTLRVLAQEENRFLNNLYLLPLPVKLLSLLWVQVVLYEPVVLYSVFMGYYAFQYNQYGALLLLCLYNMLSIAGAVLFYIYRLRHISAESKQSRLSMYVNRSFIKPYFTFFPYQVLHKQLSLFLLTKLFSLLLITGTVKLYIIEDYSQVLLSLGILISFSANAVLAFHFNGFEQAGIRLLKNMPVRMSKRFFHNVLSYICLLAPEILLLLRYLAGDITLWIACKLVLFGLSLQLVFYSYVLYRQPDLDIFIRHIFFICLFYLLGILFRIDILPLALLNIGVAYFIFQKYFYKAEAIILQSKPLK